MYIVIFYIPQFDGDPKFKVEFFSTLHEAEQFAERLEKRGLYNIHGIYEATKVR